MKTLSSLGRAAVAYAERLRWPVFPLAARGKLPMVSESRGGRGHLDATTDREQITEWWHRYPMANIGIACDERSGLLALDVDPRHGGDDELAAIETQHGALPHTIEAVTGGQGRHLLYRRPPGVNFRGKLCNGVDIKASGYIVAAPSIHGSGRPYAWEASSHPLETELAELPSWVLRKIISYQPDGLYGEPADDAARSFLALAFAHAGWLGGRIDRCRINARCPWEDEHSARSGSGGTIIFAPRQGSGAGWFHCSHTSHGPKSMSDVIGALPRYAVQLAAADIAMQCAEDAEYEVAERAAIQGEGEL